MAQHGNTTHGCSNSKEYIAWTNMLARCRNPNDPRYPLYGGRGIRVCHRWSKFEKFLADVGIAPSAKHSLDRQRVNGHYTPKNCRWVLKQVQARNRRTCRRYTHDGKSFFLWEWALIAGINIRTIKSRLSRGWSFREIMTRPAVSRRVTPAERRQRYAARAAVFRAVRSGRLRKPSRCQRCRQSHKLSAHHNQGYIGVARLQVRWLCKQCHPKEEAHG